jgi:UDP-N-acetylglucosamine acyltransferase
MPTIHPTAVISPGAEIAADVVIGPFCTVGPKVKLATGVKLVSHVAVMGSTSVGERCVVWPFAVLGAPPQDKSYRDEDTKLVIGADNILREQVTMQLGTPKGRGVTTIGAGGYYMTGAHVGHDCIVGEKVTFANNATLGGHVVIGDFVNMGGLSAVHQLGRVGEYAFVGGGAPLTGDVIPYGMVDNHGRLHGLNLVGLKRRGFPRDVINELRAVYRELFLGEGHFQDRLNGLTARFPSAETRKIVDFIEAGMKRPLCMPGPQ